MSTHTDTPKVPCYVLSPPPQVLTAYLLGSSWDLGIAMKKKRFEVSDHLADGWWEVMTGWADDSMGEEAEENEERWGSDADVLRDVVPSPNCRRRPFQIEFARSSGRPVGNRSGCIQARKRMCLLFCRSWTLLFDLFNAVQFISTVRASLHGLGQRSALV
jgi:hypothetical protein